MLSFCYRLTKDDCGKSFLKNGIFVHRVEKDYIYSEKNMVSKNPSCCHTTY